MSMCTSARWMTGVAMIGLLAITAPDADAFLENNTYSLFGRDSNDLPLDTCWEFTDDGSLHIDGADSGTWEEFDLLSFLFLSVFPFGFWNADIPAGNTTARGLSSLGFMFGRLTSDTEDYIFLGFISEEICD